MEANAVTHLRRKYKDRMLALAFIVSGWSPQPEGGHGCVLAVDGKFIVSTGFTGPDRAACENAEHAGLHEPAVVHAEVNALLNLKTIGYSSQVSKRLVAYVTKKPCKACFNALVGAGVVAMFWLQDCNGDGCGWTAGQKLRRYGRPFTSKGKC